ncbi:hypothetical protein RKD32_006023 [Streptomyces sp. SAI-195]|nr:hypothetical protein [Streptomyces coelicoflavus]
MRWASRLRVMSTGRRTQASAADDRMTATLRVDELTDLGQALRTV